MNAELLIAFLRSALNRVGQDYYGGRVADWMFDNHGIHEKHPKRKNLEKYLSRYGERVFCYELYHQTRLLIDTYYAKNPRKEGDKFVIFQGELKKNQIKSVIDYFVGVRAPLKKEYIPDFLLHSIGNFDGQELVVEVKSNPLLSIQDLKNDLLKIQEFISRYGYRKGVFLSVNTPYGIISTHLTKLSNSKWFDHALENKNDIVLLHKEGQGSPTYGSTLDSLPLTEE